MGVLYNVPPVRTKEWPYVDVLSESINNPIRLFLGWFALIADRVPPLSLALSYWMIGAFFMAMKRYAEYRHIGDPAVAAAYRHSFKHYTEERLLVSILFYATTCALFAGIFIVRYHLELLLFVPQAAGLFAYYLHLGMKPDSPTQNPEKLYRERGFVAYLVVCFAVFVLLMFTRVPVLYQWFNVEPAGTSPLWTVGEMISFVIPVRNAAADLPRCLSSIAGERARASRRVEIVVVDNGSSDDSAEIARRLGARVIERPGLTVGACRNAGAADSRGDVLAFVDADNEIAAGWLHACLRAFQEQGVGAAGFPYEAPARPHLGPADVRRAARQASRSTGRRLAGGGQSCRPARRVREDWRFRRAAGSVRGRAAVPVGAQSRLSRRERARHGQRASRRSADAVAPVLRRVVARSRQPARQPPGTVDASAPCRARCFLLRGWHAWRCSRSACWRGPGLAQPLPRSGWLGLLAIATAKALVVIVRGRLTRPLQWAQGFVVAATYETARALSLVSTATHRTRVRVARHA